jgi:protease IV
MASPMRVAGRAGANLARAMRRLVARAALPRRTGAWLLVRLAHPLDEPAPHRLPFAGEASLTLLELLEALERAAADPQIDGVLLRFSGTPLGFAKALSLRRAVRALRAAGKPVAVWAERLDAQEYLVASAATRLWLAPVGELFLVGLRLDGFYLGGLLDQLDIKAEVVRIGSHKSAAEHLTRQSMSPEEREQLDTLIDDLFEELIAQIAAGRGMPPDAVRALIDRGPFRASAAAEAGLSDGCLYPDEIPAALEALTPIPPADRPGPRRVRLLEAPLYRALNGGDAGWRPLFRGLPRIAYVALRGAIHRGTGTRGIASDSVRRLLEALGRDGGVHGVVLRIESPGGDGVASDLLWRAVAQLAKEKPVVASMGDVAASGGYYLASAADTVFAEAGTLTGSIGVVGGKPNLEGLYRRIGVARDAVERGTRAGLLSETRSFTPGERAALREDMAALYATFVARVAEGRGLSTEAVERVAQGRVWSGARAHALGLVDALGGPLEALREVRRRAGLREGERVLVEAHPRLSALSSLRWLRQLLSVRFGGV